MQVHNINNQPSFGIKYANKRAWNKEVLKTFENSKLLKEIDKKYPDSLAAYNKIKDSNEILMDDPWYTTILDLFLNDNKIYRWGLSSRNPESIDKNLKATIETLTLDEVEKNATSNYEPIIGINIKKFKNQNIFTRILNKFLG